jgi:diaminohydroxyphosphoribosylaminopyrimidine deaminase/5-amino-6-(5-phosphoribosylamino)uracil reductase
VDALGRDERYMIRALELAAEGIGRVEPNPAVGAVVVRDARVVGEGFHGRFGGPHAEVVALQQAGPLARGAELFVSLEPCCHHGKTPPCTETILASGVRRVVAAMTDPFPEVAGRGLRMLKEAGVETMVGVLEERARRLNAAYLKRLRTGLPLVIAKWAMTLDGRVADASGDSRWISSEASRRLVHQMRRLCDAVVVGAGTVQKDEPLLTVRHVEPLPERGQPLRVVLDGRLVIDPSREPVRSAREVLVIVYTTAEALAERSRADALRAAGCELVAVPKGPGGVSLTAAIEDMGRRGMSRILVEGGPHLFGSLFAERLADRVMIFISPRILGSAAAPGPATPGRSPATPGRSPVLGPDGRTLADALQLEDLTVQSVGPATPGRSPATPGQSPDVLIEGRLGEF